MLVTHLIEDIVSKLGRTIDVLSVEIHPTITGAQILEVCNTYHLTTQCPVTIGINEYEVVSVKIQTDTDNGEIVVQPGPVISEGATITLPAPAFFRGEPKDTNRLMLKKQDDGDDIFPMVYLNLGFKMAMDQRPGSADLYTTSLFIYCLAKSDEDEWLYDTDDYYSNAIEPMHNLVAELVKEMKDEPRIGIITRDERLDDVHFGLIRGRTTDSEEHLFDERASGVQLQIDFPVKKSFICKTKC